MKSDKVNMFIGTLFIISAPSGAGKSSLIRAYLAEKNHHPAKVSISHTTRSPRPGEQHGEDYYFVDHNHFESLISDQAFVEYAHVFDHYYGTSKAEIEQSLLQGVNVFLDIDWQGAQQVRDKMPQSKSIFILPPSLTELENRLIKRGQDNEEVIGKRMAKAQAEISHYNEYDYVIINDDFDTSLNALTSIITSASLERRKQEVIHHTLFDNLLKKNNK